MTKTDIDKAVEVCEQWFAHLERQKQNTETLQKAAALARKGDRVGAKRLQSQVDNQPKVYDGARLEPAVRTLIETLKSAQGVDDIPDSEALSAFKDILNIGGYSVDKMCKEQIKIVRQALTSRARMIEKLEGLKRGYKRVVHLTDITPIEDAVIDKAIAIVRGEG